MDRPSSTDTEVSASPLLAWLESLDASVPQEPCLKREAFASLVDSLDANESCRRDTTGRPVTPAGSVRRPDSRLPRIRHAFQRRARAALLRAWPPVDRAFADTRFIEKVLVDLDRVSLAVSARIAQKQLSKKQGELHGQVVSDGTPRSFRPKDEDSAEQRYHRQLQIAAREHMDRFGDGAPLDLPKARQLFKTTAGLESKSRYTAAGLERGALRHLGPLGERELVSLLDAGGGALGYCSRAQGRLDVSRPWADPTAVTCRCEEPPLEAIDNQEAHEADFGKPPPWQSRARVLASQSGRKSHRQQLREELRREGGPPSVTALHDTVSLAQVGKAVLEGDASALLQDRADSLWNGPNPSIIAPELQSVLGTTSCRFPLLFVAAFSGEPAIWNYLTELLAKRDQLLPHLVEDVEGWHLPVILCLAPPSKIQSKDSKRLLQSFFHLMGSKKLQQRPISYCLLLPREEHWEGDAAGQPMHLLLERGSDVWPQLVEMLVREGGFCHEEESGRIALVGRILAERGCMKDFLDACAKGGDAVQPQSQAMAGLYLGVLKSSVPPIRCLSALQALLENGLAPAAPLTPSADQWPLHAAARHNCLPVVKVLLVAKADPFARNVRGLTALEVAKHSRSWAAAAAIRRAPFKSRAFHVQLVAEALARHIEELHASQVAADIEDVAQALLRHLEDSVSADTDLVAGALAQMAVAMPLAPDASREEEVWGRSPNAATAESTDLVANALAQMAIAAPLPPDASREEVWGRSPNAATAESTDLVANALAQMAIATPLPQPDASKEEEIYGASPHSGHADLVEHVLVRMMMASPLPGDDSFQEDVRHEVNSISSGRSEIVHTDVVAHLLARMLLDSPDPKSEPKSDSLQHEEVSSGHSDNVNTTLVANVLARMVLAATPSPGPNPETLLEEDTYARGSQSGGASNVDQVAAALAQMVLANSPQRPDVRETLEDQDCDREVANAAGRALAGVVVAAHGAANLEEVDEMLSHLAL